MEFYYESFDLSGESKHTPIRAQTYGQMSESIHISQQPAT